MTRLQQLLGTRPVEPDAGAPFKSPTRAPFDAAVTAARRTRELMGV